MEWVPWRGPLECAPWRVCLVNGFAPGGRVERVHWWGRVPLWFCADGPLLGFLEWFHGGCPMERVPWCWSCVGIFLGGPLLGLYGGGPWRRSSGSCSLEGVPLRMSPRGCTLEGDPRGDNLGGHMEGSLGWSNYGVPRCGSLGWIALRRSDGRFLWRGSREWRPPVVLHGCPPLGGSWRGFPCGFP